LKDTNLKRYRLRDEGQITDLTDVKTYGKGYYSMYTVIRAKVLIDIVLYLFVGPFSGRIRGYREASRGAEIWSIG
jgi:hypothetical protein